MHTVQIDRGQWLWISVALVAVLMLAACGTNTGGRTDPHPVLTYPIVGGYGTTYGCPSDVVVKPEPPAPNVVVNIKQSHTIVTAHIGNVVEIRLPFGHTWDGPRTLQAILQLHTPSGYAMKDKGVCVWRFVAQSAGTAHLTFYARAICERGQLCPLFILLVPFTIRVQ